jgi:methylenetetrahydrofolate--tRNA-(uracil-5-)-methyltransferase
MGAAFGIIDPLDERIKDKKERYERLAQRSLDYYKTIEL